MRHVDAGQRRTCAGGNPATGTAFEFDPGTLLGRTLSESVLTPGVPAIRKALDVVRAAGGEHGVETAAGYIAIAPLMVDGRLTGFIVRRGNPRTIPLADELAVTRSELDATRRELQSANEELQITNEDLRRRVEELQVAAVAERNKDDFLAMLAHELRTPLAPILSAVQILRRQAADDPMVLRAREVVERQALHQARLLDDLLDVSRITRGKIELRRQTVSLGDAVTEALEATRGLIQAKAQSISVALPEEPIFVDADPTRLTQVVTNLVNNAAKYTHAGGRIGIACERGGEHAVGVVRDNGSGIPREMLSRIFDLFAQPEPSTARTQGGLGIGLTLVKNLVERLRWRTAPKSLSSTSVCRVSTASRSRDGCGQRWARPPLIGVTGYGQPENRRLSREAGFDVHLVKPVSPEQLAAALESRRAGEAA